MIISLLLMHFQFADEYKCCIFFRNIFPASNHIDLFGHVERLQVSSVSKSLHCFGVGLGLGSK